MPVENSRKSFFQELPQLSKDNDCVSKVRMRVEEKKTFFLLLPNDLFFVGKHFITLSMSITIIERHSFFQQT